MRVVNCIVCEDIRRELGNKHSLMGVYDCQLVFPVTGAQAGRWPKFKQLSMFIRLEREREDELEDVVYIAVEMAVGDYVKEIARVDITKRQPGFHIHLVAVLNPFTFVSAGAYRFHLRILDAYQHTLEKKQDIYLLQVGEQVIDQNSSVKA
jgi:hypothetical protein